MRIVTLLHALLVDKILTVLKIKVVILLNTVNKYYIRMDCKKEMLLIEITLKYAFTKDFSIYIRKKHP